MKNIKSNSARYHSILGVSFALGLVLFFQNCSPMKMSALEESHSSSLVDNHDPNLGTPPNEETNSPTPISSEASQKSDEASSLPWNTVAQRKDGKIALGGNGITTGNMVLGFQEKKNMILMIDENGVVDESFQAPVGSYTVNDLDYQYNDDHLVVASSSMNVQNGERTRFGLFRIQGATGVLDTKFRNNLTASLANSNSRVGFVSNVKVIDGDKIIYNIGLPGENSPPQQVCNLGRVHANGRLDICLDQKHNPTNFSIEPLTASRSGIVFAGLDRNSYLSVKSTSASADLVYSSNFPIGISPNGKHLAYHNQIPSGYARAIEVFDNGSFIYASNSGSAITIGYVDERGSHKDYRDQLHLEGSVRKILKLKSGKIIIVGSMVDGGKRIGYKILNWSF